jgi:arylformamidase
VAEAVLPFTPAVVAAVVPRVVVAAAVAPRVVAAADADGDRPSASRRMLDVKPVRPFPNTLQGSSSPGKEAAMPIAGGGGKIVDISLELDAKNFGMRTPAGFTKDMQFAMEILKEHDAPGGAGQIVRGVHMRLHAGSHVDAPEHNVRGGTQIHQLPLELFIGEAIVADLRDKMPAKAITEHDLDKTLGARVKRGDRVLLRTDHNNAYDGGSDTWMKTSPYLTIGATQWLIDKGVVIVGYDFYHGNDEPGAPRVFHNSRTLSEHGIITMPYLKNLDRITSERFTLIALPLNIVGAEASPVRAVVLL